MTRNALLAIAVATIAALQMWCAIDCARHPGRASCQQWPTPPPD